MPIADNLARVHERIANAAVRAGRSPDEIALVGVTKYVDSTAAAELVKAGCRDLGESRPQELWQKHAEVDSAMGQPADDVEIRWHLIGHLQRNKVHRTLPLVHMIHSVDSERLLTAIQENAARPEFSAGGQRPAIKVLLEVKTSGEAAKHGLRPEEAELMVANAKPCRQVEICGLMTMAALEGGEAVAAKNFAALRGLRDRLQKIAPPHVQLTELSMGMSGDFETAIAEGATIVRVGSALWD
jgi:pyridoxal phosphate enzyme (YggS family)